MLHSLQLLTLFLGARLDRARDDERGASAVEWVIITALLVGIAAAVGAILLNTIEDGANSIDLGI
ncbi:hypothetical protein [Nocardioides perillae]|uniref:Flp pilus assembly pilin Flp n=1 Tax=Nocardioides perillae TaxID=1119534 RepID=A0A7Y9RTN7_9ACTN|nr:hypothetical protein [Nocardioides perillae]NYG55129.1 Flp pilus assembly pilin Flp [Nocardioides perillae]